MLNKLKTTTALVGALTVAATSASVAETKVFGDIEQTFSSVSRDLEASKVDGTSGFGTETNIGLKSSKDLDNGMTAKYGFVLEADSTAKSDSKYLTLESGNVGVTFGEDTGKNLQSSIVPFIGDNFETVGASNGGGLDFDSHGSDLNVHENAHVSLDVKFEGGQATLRYAPNQTSKTGDSTISSGNSATEYLVGGKTAGVSYLFGKMVGSEGDAANAGDDNEYTVTGLGYTYNNITVAAERRKTDNGSTAATAEETADQFGIAASLGDNFSAGIYLLQNEQETTTTEEEAKMIQIGYNLGGLGIDVSYMQIEDAAYAAGDDADVIQIRTKQKF